MTFNFLRFPKEIWFCLWNSLLSFIALKCFHFQRFETWVKTPWVGTVLNTCQQITVLKFSLKRVGHKQDTWWWFWKERLKCPKTNCPLSYSKTGSGDNISLLNICERIKIETQASDLIPGKWDRTHNQRNLCIKKRCFHAFVLNPFCVWKRSRLCCGSWQEAVADLNAKSSYSKSINQSAHSVM